jgi:hypothetical protein
MGGLLFEDGLPDLAGLDELTPGEEIIGLVEVGRVGIGRHG